MPYIVDDAQRAESLFRQAALASVCRVGQEQPLEIDGRACCCDCEEPIPLARLLAVPQACRCAACQEDADQAPPGASP